LYPVWADVILVSDAGEYFMVDVKKAAGKLIALCLFPLTMAACTGEPAVSYSQDVKPILDEHCMSCHQPGKAGEVASGFNVTTYDDLMMGLDQDGTRKMVIPGDVESSNILVLMEGRADPSISMPHGQQKSIAAENIEIVRLWVKQGAKNN